MRKVLLLVAGALLPVTALCAPGRDAQGESAPMVKARGSSTPRTLQDRFADVANVKDFGASGNGTENDTDAVVAAYNSLGPSGGTIFFPRGTYRFNLKVAKSGVTLQGAGMGSVATKSAGTRFTAANPSIPLVQVGDGTSDVRGVKISDVLL